MHTNLFALDIGFFDFLSAVSNASTLATLNKVKNQIFTLGSHFILIEWPKEIAAMLLKLLDLKESKIKPGAKTPQGKSPSRGNKDRSLSPTPTKKSGQRSPSKTPGQRRIWSDEEESALRKAISKVWNSYHITYTYMNMLLLIDVWLLFFFFFL